MRMQAVEQKHVIISGLMWKDVSSRNCYTNQKLPFTTSLVCIEAQETYYKYLLE